MNVCLITRFFDLRNGGIGRFSMELKTELERRNVSLTPISDPGQYNGQSYLKYTLLKLRQMMPQDCDVYHCLTPCESLYAPKKRTVVTFHDLIPWLHSEGLVTHYTGLGIRGRANRFISKHYFHLAAASAARAARVVCTSRALAREVMKNLNVDAAKVRIIRLGINPNLRPAQRNNKTYRIGTLSYIDARKRIDLLIRAFLEANVDGELVIAGEGPDEPRLKELARGDQRIKFLGFIPEERVADFYNSLDLFAFPTKIEGYGLPIVEAMACGKPVLVLDDSTIPDELKLRCITTNNMTRALRERATSLVDNTAFAQSHSWSNCAEAYLHLYEELL